MLYTPFLKMVRLTKKKGILKIFFLLTKNKPSDSRFFGGYKTSSLFFRNVLFLFIPTLLPTRIFLFLLMATPFLLMRPFGAEEVHQTGHNTGVRF